MVNYNHSRNIGLIDINISEKKIEVRPDQLEIYKRNVEKTVKKAESSLPNR